MRSNCSTSILLSSSSPSSSSSSLFGMTNVLFNCHMISFSYSMFSSFVIIFMSLRSLCGKLCNCNKLGPNSYLLLYIKCYIANELLRHSWKTSPCNESVHPFTKANIYNNSTSWFFICISRSILWCTRSTSWRSENPQSDFYQYIFCFMSSLLSVPLVPSIQGVPAMSGLHDWCPILILSTYQSYGDRKPDESDLQ